MTYISPQALIDEGRLHYVQSMSNQVNIYMYRVFLAKIKTGVFFFSCGIFSI